MGRLITVLKSFFAFLLLSLLATSARAVDPPPLGKTEAKVILEFMDFREITVIAIRQGVDAKGTVAPIYATVIGLGKCRGHYQNICQTLYYDAELEWHAIELSERTARVWSKLGLLEIKPWATW